MVKSQCIVVLMLAGLAVAQVDSGDARYISPARYLAGSRVNDPDAPGGWGGSDNFPTPIQGPNIKTTRLWARLSHIPSTKKLTAEILNGSYKEVWFPAADSNLRAYLQAKDSRGTWRPIQYHGFYGCGNSYHRVQLPPGHMWSFPVELPSGSFKTKIRLKILTGGEPLYSNEAELSIPLERFDLTPSLRSNMQVNSEGEIPTLVYKRDAPPPL